MDLCSPDIKELDAEVIVGLLVTLTVIGGPVILFSFLRRLSTDQNQVTTVLTDKLREQSQNGSKIVESA